MQAHGCLDSTDVSRGIAFHASSRSGSAAAPHPPSPHHIWDWIRVFMCSSISHHVADFRFKERNSPPFKALPRPQRICQDQTQHLEVTLKGNLSPPQLPGARWNSAFPFKSSQSCFYQVQLQLLAWALSYQTKCIKLGLLTRRQGWRTGGLQPRCCEYQHVQVIPSIQRDLPSAAFGPLI